MLGAAVATVVSYFVIWCIRIINAKKYINLRIKLIRDLFSYFILLLQAVVLLKFTSVSLYIIECTLLLLLFAIYKEEIKKLFKTVKNYKESLIKQ